MGRHKRSASLFVSMNGESVGTLKRSSSGNLEFSYSRTWLESEKSRPISLSIPLGETVYSGDRVENFFDNLLPDSQPIRNRIQTQRGQNTKGSKHKGVKHKGVKHKGVKSAFGFWRKFALSTMQLEVDCFALSFQGPDTTL